MNVVHIGKCGGKFKIMHNFIQVGCALNDEALAIKTAQMVAKLAGVQKIERMYEVQAVAK